MIDAVSKVNATGDGGRFTAVGSADWMNDERAASFKRSDADADRTLKFHAADQGSKGLFLCDIDHGVDGG